MNLRNNFIFAALCAAAIGFGPSRHSRADELQSRNEIALGINEHCAAGAALGADPAGCERIGGHLRVESRPRIPDPLGFGRASASPAAVRTDGGMQSRGRLYLPGGESGFDPFRR
jgi:hypothetical protein